MHHSIEKNKARDKQQGERTAPNHRGNALHDKRSRRTPQKRVSAATPNTTPKTPKTLRNNCESAAQSAPKNNSAAKLRGNQTISPRSNCFFYAGVTGEWMELCDSTDDCQHRSTDVSRVPDVDGSLIGDGTIIARRLLQTEIEHRERTVLGQDAELTATGRTRQVCYKYSMFYIKPLCKKKKESFTSTKPLVPYPTKVAQHSQ